MGTRDDKQADTMQVSTSVDCFFLLSMNNIISSFVSYGHDISNKGRLAVLQVMHGC